MNHPLESGLAIVVVNYASHELLETNLVPLAVELPGTDIVVVDNVSTSQERAAITALGSAQGWTVLTPDGNLGFGGGMNAGVDEAARRGARFFLLLNPDARISRSDVLKLAAAVHEDPMSVLCPVIHTPDGAVWFDGAVVDLERGVTMSARRSAGREGHFLPWLTGACMMMGGPLWKAIGGFDERYFLYWEDVDLSVRAAAAGGRVGVLRSAVAVHDEGGTQREASEKSPREKSPLYYYYNIRNRQLFASLHLDDAGRRSWRRSAVAAAYEVLLRGGRRQFLTPVPALGAAMRGLRDGDRLLRSGAGAGASGFAGRQ